MSADPTRRRVLAVAAATAAGVAGCAPGRAWPWATPPTQAADVGMLKDMIVAENALVAAYARVVSAFPVLAAAAAPLLRQHQEHLAALLARLVIPAGAGPSASAMPRAHPAAGGFPASERAAVAYLRAAERAQAAGLTGRLAVATPSLAQLFASIAASEASHAALLAGNQR
ncbi:MAG TPA: hypothetical protein VGI74_10035 [Streptosporangiaceae bacterium]